VEDIDQRPGGGGQREATDTGPERHVSVADPVHLDPDLAGNRLTARAEGADQPAHLSSELSH
jgi:hypothetical protein